MTIEDLKKSILEATAKFINDIATPGKDHELLIREFSNSIASKSTEFISSSASYKNDQSKKYDYSKVFEIIKSQEQQFVSQLTEIRKFASTWLLGTLGGISLLLVQKQGEVLLIDQYLLISLIALMGSLGLTMLWVLDRKVYHKLLNATILAGLQIENQENDVPTMVRTDTLRLTGQLGMPIVVFYVFPIFFLLFISFLFFFQFINGWTLQSIILLACYAILIISIGFLSRTKPFYIMAKELRDFEKAKAGAKPNSSEPNKWEKTIKNLETLRKQRYGTLLYYILDLIFYDVIIWLNLPIKYIIKPIKYGLVLCTFAGIIIIQSLALSSDFSPRITQAEIWKLNDEIITTLQTDGYNTLSIQLDTELNTNICNQLTKISKTSIDTENCSDKDLSNKTIQIYTNKGNNDSQIKLIENLLLVNGLKPEFQQETNQDNINTFGLTDKILLREKN